MYSFAQRAECILFLDLFVSGLPLGVLTAVELFYFNIEHVYEWEPEVIWEVIKLCRLSLLPLFLVLTIIVASLLVDVIGGSYFLFYVLIWPEDHEPGESTKLIDDKQKAINAGLNDQQKLEHTRETFEPIEFARDDMQNGDVIP